MKNYKDFEKIYIGSSDIATLTVRCGDKLESINFGEDGAYYAYVIEEPAELGAHYKKVLTFKGCPWLWIFDDTQRVIQLYDERATEFCIYRAGDFGCIIEIKKDSYNK